MNSTTILPFVLHTKNSIFQMMFILCEAIFKSEKGYMSTKEHWDACGSALSRLENCIKQNGHHLEDAIFDT